MDLCIKCLLRVDYVCAWHSVGHLEVQSDWSMVIAHQELTQTWKQIDQINQLDQRKVELGLVRWNAIPAMILLEGRQKKKKNAYEKSAASNYTASIVCVLYQLRIISNFFQVV